jgi:glycosyltransferase involved in cell wall biosynthesis
MPKRASQKISQKKTDDAQLGEAIAQDYIFGGPEAAPAAEIDPVSRRRADLELVAGSGIFDASFYLKAYQDIAEAGVDALEHYFDYGWREGRRASAYFDTNFYLQQNADVKDAAVQPLLHYIAYGDAEGRKPSLIFDSFWYRSHYGLQKDQNALAHYLKHRASCKFAPLPDFDVEHYARSYPDVVAAQIDPFEHFVFYGYREGRSPSAEFDAKFYTARYLGNDANANPFLHYLAHKHEPGIFGRMPLEETSIPREVKKFTRPSGAFEEFQPLPKSAPRRAKVLAYYLTQFHAFPENDAWWGKGFTEWTNVPRGLPRFRGHYQPRVPRDLGFYSLGDAETIRRQSEMAKAGGVHGFVFYYYWFNQKRLLERPLEAFLKDPTIDMPFCLMWANENWTRRWDGAESEVLISQDYRESDEDALMADFARHFADKRYIRVQGRPLLMIYRPGLIPGGRATVARWRKEFKHRYKEDPILVMGQTFLAVSPEEFDLDGAIEFPPHKLTADMPAINPTLEYLDIEFEGKAYRYDDVVRVSLDEAKPIYPLIKTAVPSWDNDARRQGSGIVLTDSTPDKYQAWLSELIDRAVKEPFFGEPIVCVNAWNEWCEAAYLEPDLHYGSAYLNATARAVVGKYSDVSDNRVLLVGHDCFPSGAQNLLLNIGRTLKSHFAVDVATVVMQGGEMEAAYRELGTLKISNSTNALEAHFRELRQAGYGTALVNTSVAAPALEALAKAGIDATLLVHELPRVLKEKQLTDIVRAGVKHCRRFVFPANFVMRQFATTFGLGGDHDVRIIPQGMYQKLSFSEADGRRVRSEMGLAPGHRLVLGIGYADLRKGFDLFLQLWRLVHRSSLTPVHFCWVGGIDPTLKEWMSQEMADAGKTGTFHMAGFQKDVSAFLAAADAFVLTSREDPFPSVVLEALYAGLPVAAFAGTGGIPELLAEHPLGHVVPLGDTVALSEVLTERLRKPTPKADKLAGRETVESDFNFSNYVWTLLRLLKPELPEISVAIPNYNYAAHLPKRMSSVFLQSQPVREIVVLDDCSTDNSVVVIPAVAADWGRSIQFLPNVQNSGSVFKQWRKAAESCRSEFLWIAEADDLSDPGFLSKVVALMQHDKSVQFAFSDSASIDGEDLPVWPSYRDYYASVGAGTLAQTRVYEAHDFVSQCLAVKNLILNVSALVWRREALLEAIVRCEQELKNYRMAGDWRLYLEILSKPGARAAYCNEPLNTHRRHSASVTHRLKVDLHVAEIAACQAFARSSFDLGPEVQASQQQYLTEVTAQLKADWPEQKNEVAGRKGSSRPPLKRE